MRGGTSEGLQPLSCGTPSPLRYMKPRSNCAAASPSVARLRNPATSGAFWQLTSATTVNSQMQHDAATSRRWARPHSQELPAHRLAPTPP